MSCKWHSESVNKDIAQALESHPNSPAFDDNELMFGSFISKHRDITGQQSYINGWSLQRNVVNNLMTHMTVAARSSPEVRRMTNPISNSTPAGMTYLGQMITHDIVLDTDKDGNKRVADPALNLSSLFWSDSHLADKEKFDERGRFKLRSVEGRLNVDLPRRNKTIAIIPEQRNDENLIIAQLHVLWLRVHNVAIDILNKDARSVRDVARDYQQARSFTTLLFQRVVVDEYLKITLDPLVYREYFENHESYIYDDALNHQFKIPREFSHAVFRFGHSMIKQRYQLNVGDDASTSLDDLIKVGPPQTLQMAIDWNLFFDLGDGQTQQASSINLQLASDLSHLRQLKMFAISNQAEYATDKTYAAAKNNEIIELLLQRGLNAQGEFREALDDSQAQVFEKMYPLNPVGFKNIILRDIAASRYVPTGGDICRIMTEEKLLGRNHRENLRDKLNLLKPTKFDDLIDFSNSSILRAPIGTTLSANNAPLWLFTLREAEEFPRHKSSEQPDKWIANPDRLGPISSVVVAEVLRQSLLKSSTNILQQPCAQLSQKLGQLTHTYSDLVCKSSLVTMADVINFINSHEENQNAA